MGQVLRRSLHLLLANHILFIACAACAAPEQLPVAFDLVEQFPLAEILQETGRIDFGSVAAREHLLEGWSWDENTASGSTFAWGTGSHSSVRIFIA